MNSAGLFWGGRSVEKWGHVLGKSFFSVSFLSAGESTNLIRRDEGWTTSEAPSIPGNSGEPPSLAVSGLPRCCSDKESCQRRRSWRLGLTPGSGKSPGVGNGSPLQYSCLENPHGQRRLAGYSPWVRKELDMTMHAHIFKHPHPMFHGPRLSSLGCWI